MRSLVTLLPLFTLYIAAAEQLWQIGEQVQTSSGTIVGHHSKDRPEVSEYLGIPFVQAPVGQLRWAAPVPFKGTGTILADKFVCSRCHSWQV
jgi:cholinesterase